MCGIAGFSISDTEHRVINSRKLAKSLLLEIQKRGTDATGAAWSETVNDERQIFYAKQQVPASHFVNDLDTLMPRHTRTAILHTRYATKGSPANEDNNHPILVPNGVIGVHNGVIVNDDDLFDQHGWDRIAEVDSEAIFQLLADPSLGIARLGELIGRAAIAWFDVADANTLHIARLEGSPLVIGHTLRGSVVFASTEPLLKAATNRLGLRLSTVWHVPQFFYMKIVNGKTVERTPLEEHYADEDDSEWLTHEFIN